MTAEPIVFVLLAALAITTAVVTVIHRNPVMSAISLIANFFCLAALYLLLRAQLLAVLEVAVYAGAIMVLVVFVIMLLNVGEEAKRTVRLQLRTVVGVVLVLALVLELVYLFTMSQMPGGAATLHPDAGAIGTVEAMGLALFSRYLLPLQVTGLLLLAAIVGAVILAKRKIS